MSAEVVNEVASQGVLGTLGVNWRLFVAQLINFLVVVFVLWRWAWKPLVKLLDDRSRRIEQSLADAKKIEEEMRRLNQTRANTLRDAEREAQAVITEARAVAAREREETIVRTRAEVDKTLRDAKEVIRAEKTTMLAEARAELADIVVAAAGKVLEEEIDDRRHRELAQRALDKMRV